MMLNDFPVAVIPPALLADTRLAETTKDVAVTLLYDGPAPLPIDEKVDVALRELELFGYVFRVGAALVATL